MSTPRKSPDYPRLARLLNNAETFASNLDQYQSDNSLDQELKNRLATAQRTIRLLSKTLIIEIDQDHITDKWDDIVPKFIERHHDT